jgi:hypothetical protein
MSDAAERASKRRKDLIGVDRLRHGWSRLV